MLYNNNREQLIALYRKLFGVEASEISPIAQSGSNRRYFRLSAAESPSVIGVVGVDASENRAFVEISKVFERQSIPSPRVLAVSDDYLCYLQTDLGDTVLFDRIAEGRQSGVFSPEGQAILHRTIAYLPDIQFKVADKLDFSVCYPQSELDRRNVMFDLNYFKYCFLKAVGVEPDEVALENDFEKLCQIILQSSGDEAFMYRDFQSRNVMLVDGNPYFIDYQGGRRGAIYYDVASFLWQAKANFSDQLRNELIDTYLDRLQKYRKISRADFEAKLRYFVLFRQLQVLGAYGFRGLIEKKAHFIESIPLALRNIDKLLPFAELPYISQVFDNYRIAELKNGVGTRDTTDRLTVQIESFSYKKGGVPHDYSGNGGGYVFDCRAIHNPGRYAEYKQLTGKDQAVRDFLLTRSDVLSFLDNVYALVDNSIMVYSKRGFTHLAVFFGCTGGQHRSVFCAESLAEHLKQFDVDIKLKHNEIQ